MTNNTPDDVQAALDALGVKTEIMTFTESTRTAQEAADAIGTELGSIVKSLCFKIKGDPQREVIILTAGDRRVDDKKVAAWYGVGRKKIKIADAETTIRVTGYAPGGVPPVGHAADCPILIDESLARFDLVYAAGGTANTIFPIAYEELVSVTGGEVVNVVKEGN